jgi:transposase-like protein
MAHKNERIDAKRFYIEEGLDVAAISKRINIPETTIYRWKSDDVTSGNDWDKEREAIGLTSFSATKSMLAIVVERMAQMVEEIKTSKKINPSEVYAIRQLMLSAKALQKDVDNYGNVLLMTSELTEFLAERDNETLQLIQPLLIEFGNAMSKKYGKKR